MHVPPPPDTAPTDEVERMLVPDLPPHDRQRYTRVGSDVIRRISTSRTMCVTVENYLPATTTAGAHFTLRYADGGRERISPAALDISPEPDAYILRIAVRRPAAATMDTDSDATRANCGVCAAVISDAPALCYACATLFHTSCVSSSVPGPTTSSPPTDGYDWFCSACVETHELVGLLFRSLVPLAQTDGTEPSDVVLTTTDALATADDPRHPAEAGMTPPIPDPPPGGNPARSSVEDAAADAVPIYLATKHTAYAPAKRRLFYLYMRRHYADECLARAPTKLANAVRHHSTVPRHVLFHLFRLRGALTQDEPVGARHA